MHAKLDPQGNILEIGSNLSLGSGEPNSEEWRESGAHELAAGYRIVEILLANDLQRLAAEAISQAMYDGAHTYPPSTWKQVPLQTHYDHTIRHVLDAAHNTNNSTQDLQHAICRLTMVLARTLDKTWARATK